MKGFSSLFIKFVLLCLACANSYALVGEFEFENIGFKKPLGVGSNVEPYFTTTEISTNEDVTFVLDVIRKDGGEKVYTATKTFVKEWDGLTYSYTGLWFPETTDDFYVKVSAFDSNDNLLRSSVSSYYGTNGGSPIYHYIMNGLKVAFQNAGYSISSFSDVYNVVETNYNQNKKYFFSIKVEGTYGLAGLGLTYSFDIADYLGISNEGKEGWISTWFNPHVFVGIRAPISFDLGVISVDVNANEEDSREDFNYITFGGSLQIASVKLSAYDSTKIGDGNAWNFINYENTGTTGFNVGAGFNASLTFANEIYKPYFESLINQIWRGATSITKSDFTNSALYLASGMYSSNILANNVGFIADIASTGYSYRQQGYARKLTIDDISYTTIGFSAAFPQALNIDIDSTYLEYNTNTPINIKAIYEDSELNINDDVIVSANIENTIEYTNGQIKLIDDSLDSVDVVFYYAGRTKTITFNKKTTDTITDDSELQVIKSSIPSSVTGGSITTIDFSITDGTNNITGATISAKLKNGSDTIDIFYGTELSNGNYELDIEWPNSDTTLSLEIGVSKITFDPVATNHTITISKYVEDSGLLAWREDNVPYSDRIDVNNQVKFCVNAYTSVSQLDRVEWYLNDSLYDTDNFESDEINSGDECEYIEFSTVGENQKVVAKVFRDDGVFEEEKWYRDVDSSDIPAVTIVSPEMTTDKLIYPVSSDIDFNVNVADTDDDTKVLYWYINDVLYETDKVGGGNPISGEHFDYTFVEVGEYIVVAKAVDEKGNTHQTQWNLKIGTSTPGNDAPTGEVNYPYELGVNGKLRVGYFYDFKYNCYDVDGNLAYGEVKLDGSTAWGSNYYEDNLNPYGEDVGTSDMTFTTAEEHTISLLCRDGDGAESTTNLIVNVESADEGSLNNAPEFLSIQPEEGKTFYVTTSDNSSGTDLRFYVTAKDKDGDLDRLEVYINNTLETSRSLDDFTDETDFTIDFDNTGTYTLKFRLIDEKDNYIDSGTYTVNVNSSKGNHNPEILKTYPNFLSTSQTYLVPSGKQFCASANLFDQDADLDDSYWFSTAGPLPAIDGTWSDGRDYDKLGSYNSFELNEDKCFDITQSGYIGVIVMDDNENTSSEYRWKVAPASSIGNNSPEIYLSSFSEGDKLHLKRSSDLVSAFEAKDSDGDIVRAELWIDGILNSYEDFTTTEAVFQTYEYFTNEATQLDGDEGSYDSDRTPVLPFVFKVIDSKGNEANISGKVSWGIYNHESEYPEQMLFSIYEDFPIEFISQFDDEDGDTHSCIVDTNAINGTVDTNGSKIKYIPNDNYYGDDSFRLTCSDGYGSMGNIDYNITIYPINDIPHVEMETNIIINEDSSYQGKIIIDEYDNENVTISILEDAEHGEVSIDNNILTYTPNPNFAGNDNIVLTFTDESNTSVTKNIKIIVNNIDDPATISGDKNISSNENSTISGTLNLTDIDSNTTFLNQSINGNYGSFIFNSDGTWSYSLNHNNIQVQSLDNTETLTEVFEINTSDNQTQTITLTILGVDDFDNDGLSDQYEIANGLNYLVNDSSLDSDNDGLTNLEEYNLNTDPNTINSILSLALSNQNITLNENTTEYNISIAINDIRSGDLNLSIDTNNSLALDINKTWGDEWLLLADYNEQNLILNIKRKSNLYSQVELDILLNDSLENSILETILVTNNPICESSQKLSGNSCVPKTCEDDGYNCPSCIGDQTLTYENGNGICTNPACSDSQKISNGICINLTCEDDDYNCPSCIGNQTLTYENGDGICINPTCSDSQKLLNGVCVALTCEDDNYNCPIDPVINSISFNNDTFFAGTAIKFQSTITADDGDINSYLWNFGDDTLSTLSSPTHTYESSGQYDITLSVTDSNDLSDTYNTTISVNEAVDIEAEFIPAVNMALPPYKINFYDTSHSENNITKWEWKVYDSDGDIIGTGLKKDKSLKNFTFEFETSGTFDVELTITDSEGITSTFSDTVTMIEKEQDIGDVVILAGLGDDITDPLYNAIYNLSKLSYKYFRYRGYSDDKIHFMYGNSEIDYDNDGENDLIVDDTTPTAEEFYTYIKGLSTSSSSSKPLFIYMLDHGSNNAFMISKSGEDRIVYASELKEALDEFQSQTDREVVLIIEACSSGSFLTALSNPTYNNKRAMFFSSQASQLTYIGSSGSIAFSKYMFKNLLGGESLISSYLNAVSNLKAQQSPFNIQEPVYNENIDTDLQSIKLGGDFATASLLPSIELVSTSDNSINFTQNDSFTQSIKVEAVTGIKNIWATVIPPNYKDSNSSEFYTPDLTKYKVTLTKIDDETYELEYPPQIKLNGDYNIFYTVEDNEGNMETLSSNISAIGGVSDKKLLIEKGWNLISLPESSPTDYSGANVIWGYDNSDSFTGWKAYSSYDTIKTALESSNIERLNSIYLNKGYWYFSENDHNLTLDITYNINNISINKIGWTLLGTDQNISVNNISCDNNNLDSVWKYKNGGWKLYIPNGETYGFETFDSITENEGFWINCK